MTSQSLPRPKRARRKEARPAELVEAGLAAFAEHGFERTRMDDVARRAGVAKGTVFRYFPSKEALFEAAIRSRAAPVFPDAAALPEGPLLPVLSALLERVYAQLEDPKLIGLMRIIIAEGPRFPALLEIYHRESIARADAVLAAALAGQPGVPPAIAALPMLLMSPALMASIWRMTFDAVQPVPLARFREAHLALLTAALSSPARNPPG
jgi:AcrR family transcriptional regulator